MRCMALLPRAGPALLRSALTPHLLICTRAQGVPLRLELGQKDMDNGVVVAVRRDTGAAPWCPGAAAAAAKAAATAAALCCSAAALLVCCHCWEVLTRGVLSQLPPRH